MGSGLPAVKAASSEICSAVVGLPKWYPWPTSQWCRVSQAAVSASSMPSATTVMSRVWVRLMTALTTAAALVSLVTLAMKWRSSWISSMEVAQVGQG